MDRNERLELVLLLLREQPGITVSDVERECRVSRRTVFRDLQYLRRRGYPVTADVGRGGGLALPATYGLRSVQLTPEQGICALLALAIAEKLAFPMFVAEVPQARRKLVGAFRSEDKKLIARLQDRIFLGAPASKAVTASYRPPAAALMLALQEAFVDEHAVKIGYVDEANRVTTRTVEPHALFINWPAWYLLAHDDLREAPRIFRLDRLTALTNLPERTFRSRPKAMAAALVGEFGLDLR